MADLKVTVGADISQYQAAMAEAGNTAKTASNQISQSLASAANETNAMGGAAMTASMRFYTMRSGISAARDGVMAFTLGGQAAERSLMAMGHHITSLVNETGSFKGAMAALGSSLLGPGGIILGLTIAYELISKFANAEKDAEKTGQEYIDSLNGINAAMLKGQETGAAEITRLQILYAATQNHTLSLRSRNEAYDELEKKYPQYFTDAERENTLLGKNTIGYQELTKQILAAANAKAYEDQISKNASGLFESANKRYNLEGQIGATQADIREARANLRNNPNTDQATELLRIQTDLETIKDLQDQITKRKQDELTIQKQQADLSKLATQQEVNADFKTSFGKKEADDAKTAYELLKEKVQEAKSALDDAVADNKPATFINNLALAYEKLFEQLNRVDQEIKDSTLMGKGAAPLTSSSSLASMEAIQTQPLSTEKFSDILQSGNQIDVDSMKEAVKQLGVYNDWLLKVSLDQEAFKRSQQESDRAVRLFGSGLESVFTQALSGTQNFVQGMISYLEKLIIKFVAAAAAAEVLNLVTGGSLGFANIFGQLSGLTGGASSGAGSALLSASGSSAISSPVLSSGLNLANIKTLNDTGNHQLVATLKGSDIQLAFVRSGLQKSRLT